MNVDEIVLKTLAAVPPFGVLQVLKAWSAADETWDAVETPLFEVALSRTHRRSLVAYLAAVACHLLKQQA